MANLRTLMVSVKANTKGFQKGMRRARRTLRNFGRAVRAAAMRIGAMGGALVTLAAGGGLVLLVKRAYSTIDAVSKMSDRLGIATEDLLAMHHAANITGIGVEAMNKGLRDWIRRLGEVQGGTGEAKEALKRLGLSAEDLARMAPTEALMEFAEQLNKLPTLTQQNETAYRLLGRQGQQFINFLRLGKKGMRELLDEAAALGLTFDRVVGAKIEITNDQFTRLQAVMKGATYVIAEKLAPYVKYLADTLVDAAMQGKNLGNQIVDGVKRGALAIAHLLDWCAKLRAAMATMNADFLETLRIPYANMLKYADVLFMGFPTKLGFEKTKQIRDMVNILSDSIKDFRAVAREAGLVADMEAATRGLHIWFAKLEKGIEDAARKSLGLKKAQLAVNEALAGAGGRARLATEIRLATTPIQGLIMQSRQKQAVHDAEMQDTFKPILEDIAHNTRSAGAILGP